MQVFFILFVIGVSFWFSVRNSPALYKGNVAVCSEERIDLLEEVCSEGGGRASGSIFPLPKPKKRNEDLAHKRVVCVVSGGSVCLHRGPSSGTFQKWVSRSDVNVFLRFSQVLLPALLHGWNKHLWCWEGVRALAFSWGGKSPCMSVPGTGTREGPFLLYWCFISKSESSCIP